MPSIELFFPNHPLHLLTSQTPILLYSRVPNKFDTCWLKHGIHSVRWREWFYNPPIAFKLCMQVCAGSNVLPPQ